MKFFFATLLALFSASIRSSLGFRGAFFIRVGLMALNNIIFFSTWIILFNRVGNLGDWQLRDMSLLWGISATSFGVANGFLGGFTKIPEFVRTGSLDCFLLKPYNVLLQVLSSRSEPSSWGDMLSGLGFIVLSGYLQVNTLLLIVLCILCAATVYIGAGTIFYSLAFWHSNSEDISVRFTELIIAFGSYPESIFSPTVKVLLYTIIPAAFVSFLPVVVIRNANAADLKLLIGGSITILLLAIFVFYRGLIRYESGNRWSMHGI